MPSTKKVLAVGAVAAVGIGGAVLYYKYLQDKAKSADEPEAFKRVRVSATSATRTTAPRPHRTTATERAKPAEKPKESAPAPAPVPARASASVPAPAPAPATIVHQVREPTPEYVHFEKFMCSVRPAVGWEAVSEPSPIPTSGVIMLRRPEFAEQMEAMQGMPPGAVPMVLITIEDVSSDGLTTEEVKDKAKVMSREQLMMMTNNMLEPQFVTDRAVSDAGVFEHLVEMNQVIPGMMSMTTAMYFVVKNGIAYTFQLVASPTVYAEYEKTVKAMVRDVKINDTMATKSFTELSYIEYHVRGTSVKTPPGWSLSKKKGDDDEMVAEFKTSSQVRPDSVTVYKGDHKRPSGVSTKKGSTVVNGVTVQKFTEGPSNRERRRVVVGNYTVVLVPQKSPQSPVTDYQLVTLAKSIKAVSDDSPLKITFVNITDKYKCDFREGASILSSTIGDGFCMYLPCGLESMRNGETEAPNVTIRCGHPDTDPTCAGSLEEWRHQLLQDDKSIAHIEETEIDGKPAITFSTKEMQQTGPETRSEVKTSVFITVRGNGSTCLIRWECDSGSFRRYEKQMEQFVGSFHMLV